MSSSNKDANILEKLKQALTSTARVISGDVGYEEKSDKNKSSKKFDFFQLDNLNSKSDFIKARAEFDSSALKIRFSNDNIYKKIYLQIQYVNNCTQLQKKLDMSL